jgi:EAL domain-containing protein (putative c-di-GMP-specific phosphodiesterase class I)
MKNFGVRISLDDFGTGYASLSQLRDLPFDRIKIDRSFVGSLLDDKQSNAIVHAIATLGRSLNLPITAEGVESQVVHQRLQELGCSNAQGWLFGRAISGDAATAQFFGSLPHDGAALPEEWLGRPTHERRSYARRGH